MPVAANVAPEEWPGPVRRIVSAIAERSATWLVVQDDDA
jgi:hypothetical protein